MKDILGNMPTEYLGGTVNACIAGSNLFPEIWNWARTAATNL